MKRLDDFVEKRNKIALKYDLMLDDLPVKKPLILKSNKSSFHLYIIRLVKNTAHKQIFNYFRKKNILVNLHYIPIHLQPFYSQFGFKVGNFPIAEDYYTRAISLPIFPSLKIKQQQYIIKTLREII